MGELEKQIEEANRREFERTLPERVRRASNLRYSKIIGGHYFAPASWECLQLFRDGYFLGTIMATQAVVEALVRFVAERAKRNRTGDIEEKVRELRQQKILSEEAEASILKVWRHRNDFHHLNPGVTQIDLESKAEECIEGLCFLEEEIFGGRIENGTLIPSNPRYYDIEASGTAPVFLRQFNV